MSRLCTWQVSDVSLNQVRKFYVIIQNGKLVGLCTSKKAAEQNAPFNAGIHVIEVDKLNTSLSVSNVTPPSAAIYEYTDADGAGSPHYTADDEELPGMWSSSDFTGGREEVRPAAVAIPKPVQREINLPASPRTEAVVNNLATALGVEDVPEDPGYTLEPVFTMLPATEQTVKQYIVANNPDMGDSFEFLTQGPVGR